MAHRDDPVRTISNRKCAGEQAALHHAKGVDPVLALVTPVILNFADRVGRNHLAKGQRDAMFGDVGRLVNIVKLDFHAEIYGKIT